MLTQEQTNKIEEFAKEHDLTVEFFIDKPTFTFAEFFTKDKQSTVHALDEDFYEFNEMFDIMREYVLNWLDHIKHEEQDRNWLKENQRRQERIDDLIEAAKMIMQNAESIVGTEEKCTDITVTIYIQPGEYTRINIDKNLAVMCEDKEG